VKKTCGNYLNLDELPILTIDFERNVLIIFNFFQQPYNIEPGKTLLLINSNHLVLKPLLVFICITITVLLIPIYQLNMKC